ncbi:MAG: chemotaxis protein CheW [Myxococcota bacterium]
MAETRSRRKGGEKVPASPGATGALPFEGAPGVSTLPPLPARGPEMAGVQSVVGSVLPPRAAPPHPGAAISAHASLSPSLVPVGGDPLDEFFLNPDRDGVVVETEVAHITQVDLGDDRERVLIFGLGNEEYGLEIMAVREILKPPVLTEVPRAPHPVLGVFSLRGLVLPVLALTDVLGVGGEARGGGREARVLVVGHGEDAVGLWVHRVAHVARMSRRMVEPAPGGLDGSRRAMLRGLVRMDERLIILLDLPQLLTRLGVQVAPTASQPVNA